MKKNFCIIVLFVCLVATKAYSAGSFTDGINSNGVFNLLTALDETKAVDVYGAKTDNGTNVQLYQLNDTLNQQFEIKYVNVSGNFYKIIDQNSKKALTVTGSITRKSSGVGFDVKISDYTGKDTQLWQLENAGNGYYFIKSKLGLYCLTVGNASTRNETNILASYKNWSNAQKFKLKETQPYEIIEEGTYVIESALDPNMAVDLYGGFKDNGTNIQLWEKNGTKAQDFVISYYENGYYEIADYEGDKVLDVAGGRNRRGSNVQLYEYDETDGQFWRFYKQRFSGKEYYSIRSKLGYVMDITGGATKSGTNIQIYSKNGKGANQNQIARQLFKLTKAGYAQPIYVPGASWMDKTGEGYMHDVMCSEGTPVYAIADGTIECKQIVGNNFNQSYRKFYNKLVSYGNIIYFTSEDGKTTARYAHLKGFAKCSPVITASYGYGSSYSNVGGTRQQYLGSYKVKRGEVIGYVGTTGNSSGPHLHFEIRIDGERYSPETKVSIN